MTVLPFRQKPKPLSVEHFARLIDGRLARMAQARQKGAPVAAILAEMATLLDFVRTATRPSATRRPDGAA